MKIHPACLAFPEMTPEEYGSLRDDVRQHGVQKPVEIYEGQIIDGRHRWRAAQEVGCECPTIEWHPKPGQSLIDYLVSINLERRNLTPSQRAAVATELLPLYEAEAREREQAGTLAPVGARVGKAAAYAAEATKSTARSVERAKRVKQESPETFEKVKSGEVTLHAAEKQVAKPKTPPPQRELCDAGRTVRDAKAREALTFRSEYDELVNLLQIAKRRCNALTKSPGGVRLNAQTLGADLNNAINALKFARPYTSCAKRECENTCTLCRGTRFLTKEEWNAVPEELK